MGDLSELLGQADIVRRISEALAEPGTVIVRLTGPSGSGKSHIAAEVARQWTKSNGRVLTAVGDDTHLHRDLYPLLSALSSAPYPASTIAAEATRSALQITDAVARTGGAGKSAFDLLKLALGQRDATWLSPFSGVEREIIAELRRMGRRRPVLLVADNAHWWDQGSLWVLRRILSSELRAHLNGLARVFVLLVDTAAEQWVAEPEQFAAVSTLAGEKTFRARRCKREELAAVIDCLGYEVRRDPSVLEALFQATDGHLKLIEQIAAYLDVDGVRDLGDIKESHLRALFSARLAAIGDRGAEVAELLSRAAVIGLRFGDRELRCVAGQAADIAVLMEKAGELDFVVQGSDEFVFAHEIVRRGILSISTARDLRAHRRQFAECLAKLRPSDYAARAALLEEGGERIEARTMRALAAIQALREAAPGTRVLAGLQRSRPGDEALYSFVALIAEAQEGLNRDDFTVALPRLLTPVAGESELMAAERNYVASLHELRLQSRERALMAAERLRSWEASVEDEPEMTVRFQLLRQQALIVGERYDAARSLETEVQRTLHRRASYDPEAATALQVLNRRSGALQSAEIAEARIAEAVAYFRRGTGHSARDRVELYRALNNLAAIRLRLAKDAEAYQTARECEQLVVTGLEDAPRLDVLTSNLVLAGLRSGALTPVAAAERQRLVVAGGDGPRGKFLHRCNLVAFLLLAGQDTAADALLGELQAELARDDITEGYLVYYVGALGAGAAILAGDIETATRMHLETEQQVRELNWPGSPYVRRRMSLLPIYWTDVDRVVRSAADQVLLRVHPSEIGPCWGYYARLLPCAELSFWSDS